MHKYGLIFCIVVCGVAVVKADVSYGVRGGVHSQTFGDEEWGGELWKVLGGLIEYHFTASAFSLRGDIGAGVYQRTEPLKTNKLDLQLEVGAKYLWKISSAEVGVYGGEAPYRIGISNSLAFGTHLYKREEVVSADSINRKFQLGFGLRVFGGLEYLISRYILFGEVGIGRILRGNFFAEEYSWTQITFNGGVRF